MLLHLLHFCLINNNIIIFFTISELIIYPIFSLFFFTYIFYLVSLSLLSFFVGCCSHSYFCFVSFFLYPLLFLSSLLFSTFNLCYFSCFQSFSPFLSFLHFFTYTSSFPDILHIFFLLQLIYFCSFL